VVPGMITVGRQLVAHNFSAADRILGLVSQAAGLWWISSEEGLLCSINLLDEAIDTLESAPLGSGSYGGNETLRVYLSGIVIGWRGLVIWKIKQCLAEGQLDALKEKIVLENPEKLKDKNDGSYGIPGFTSLTIEDEAEWANHLIQSAECFYQLSQIEVSTFIIN